MLKLKDLSNYTPEPYQSKGIKWLLKTNYGILADDMGLGKTFQFIANVLKRQEKAIIVCPAYLRENWKSEIGKICKREQDKSLFYVTSYSKAKSLGELIVSSGAKLIGFDEAHYLKTIDSKRTDFSLEALEEHSMDQVILMSGTPIKNRIEEWYVLLMICHWHLGTDFMDKYPNQWVFSEYFCKKRSFRIKNRMVTQYYGVRNREELLSYIRPVMLRRKLEDVLDLSKPKHIYVEANVSTIYDEELLEAFKSGKDSKAKRKSALSKVEFTSKYGQGLLESGCKAILFSCHPEAVEGIVAKIKKFKIGIITGKTPVDKRQEVVNSLQNGDLDGVACTLAASTGYTMTEANHVIMNDESYVVGDNAQLIARANRIGQTKPVIVHHIGGSKIDTNISRSLTQKMKDLERGI